MTANTVSASVAIAAKRLEQFGSFLTLNAQKKNLILPQTRTEIPLLSSTAPLCIDPLLLAALSDDSAPPTEKSPDWAANGCAPHSEDANVELSR